MDPDTPVAAPPPSPGILRYVLGFLLVGAAWGLTTPFMRKAALSNPSADDPANPANKASRKWLKEERAGGDGGNALWVKRKVWGVGYAVFDLLRRPAYAVPLLVNVTGSVWFFLLIGQAGELGLFFSVAFVALVVGLGFGGDDCARRKRGGKDWGCGSEVRE